MPPTPLSSLLPLALLLAGLPAVLAEKPKAGPQNARQVVEGYVAAATAGKTEAAAALAREGSSPARVNRIEQTKDLLGGKAPRIASVIESMKKAQALAVSDRVKLTKTNPDGSDTGCLVFTLVRIKDRWLVGDIDFRSEDAAKARVKAFKDANPDAKEIPAEGK